MADTLALSALLKKRAELAGQANAMQVQLNRLRIAIGTLDAAARLIDPAVRPELIAPKRYLSPSPRLFQPKELARLILAVLREAGQPLGSMEIARGVLVRRRLAESPMLLRRVENMCDGVLRRRENRMVERVWGPAGLAWRIAPME